MSLTRFKPTIRDMEIMSPTSPEWKDVHFGVMILLLAFGVAVYAYIYPGVPSLMISVVFGVVACTGYITAVKRDLRIKVYRDTSANHLLDELISYGGIDMDEVKKAVIQYGGLSFNDYWVLRDRASAIKKENEIEMYRKRREAGIKKKFAKLFDESNTGNQPGVKKEFPSVD